VGLGIAPGRIAQVYVSQGPGSFTGLRLGVTVARMIGWVNRAKLVGVSTLEAIAQNALDLKDPPGRVVVVLDARRRNVYASAFALNGRRYEPLGEPADVNPGEFLDRQPVDCAVLGEGVRIHRSVIEAAGRRILPDSLHASRAEHVFGLGARLAAEGRFIDLRDLTPFYVRLPEPEEKWAQRQSGA
jgi:tRNA threonylcarbamoyladenosine biosynthesis protein TsaB